MPLTVAGLLGVAFVVLKLCSVIDWSWWWVTAPFWGIPALVLTYAIGGIVIICIGSVKLWIKIKLSGG